MMKAVLFVLAMIVAVTMAAQLSNEQYQFLFTKYVDQYNKQYQTREFFGKFSTFKSNLDLIVAHNAKNLSWKMAVNQFADLSAEEFAAQFTGLNTNLGQEYAMSQLQAPVHGLRASEVDWVAKGVVNGIKNQASCGSCWAFAAISPLESRAAIDGQKLVDLSEQQLVDCSGSTGNNGCNGGLMSNAYEYLKKAGGSCLTSDYPYTAKDGSCKSCTPAVKVTGYKSIAKGDAAHIEALQSGPISVAIAASSSAFQFYSSGVLTSCSDRSINHGVTLTGYKVIDGKEAYVLRNSWGASWGNQGYMYIATGGDLCGLTTSSFDAYPLV